MIAQIWRGRTRPDDVHDLSGLLHERVQTELETSRAFRGAYLLQRPIESNQVESLVLALYDQRSLGSARCEESLVTPLISARVERLLVGCSPTSMRYEVIIDPRRAMLYAKLRRRFPLRIAALR